MVKRIEQDPLKQDLKKSKEISHVPATKDPSDSIIQKYPEGFIKSDDKASNTLFSIISKGNDLSDTQEGLFFIDMASTINSDINKTPISVKATNSNTVVRAEDQLVYGSISTWLKQRGAEPFTAKNLARILVQGSTIRANSRLVKDIEASLDRLRTNLVTIDYTHELNEKLKKELNLDSYTIEDTLLSAEKITIVQNGSKVEAYRINKEPLHMNIVERTNRILTISNKTTSISGLSLKDVLISTLIIARLQNLKYKGNNMNGGNFLKFSFASFYEKLNIDPTDRKNKDLIARTKKKIIANFEERKRLREIKDFKIYTEKDKRKEIGIEITI